MFDARYNWILLCGLALFSNWDYSLRLPTSSWEILGDSGFWRLGKVRFGEETELSRVAIDSTPQSYPFLQAN